MLYQNIKYRVYMNKEQFQGQWKIVKGKVKEKWGKLTDDEITRIDGKYDQLQGLLEKKYGYTKERAQEEINSWKLEKTKMK
jgi:uncharacterized protein YjbJ (UPF0337 family)